MRDDLYTKYRVFKEPQNAPEHPVPVEGPYYETEVSEWVMEEVTDFVFVLKPGTDHHARVALAAYAISVENDKPQLALDLERILDDTRP